MKQNGRPTVNLQMTILLLALIVSGYLFIHPDCVRLIAFLCSQVCDQLQKKIKRSHSEWDNDNITGSLEYRKPNKDNIKAECISLRRIKISKNL